MYCRTYVSRLRGKFKECFLRGHLYSVECFMCKKVSSLCDAGLLASIYNLPSVDNHDAVGVGIGRLSGKVVCGRRAVGGGFGDGDARRAAHDTHAFRILRQRALSVPSRLSKIVLPAIR